jgi:AraC-like DNA-binding protein
MKIERYLPADPLKPYVTAFMVIESMDGMVNKILPDTSVVMAFRYKGIIEDGDGVLPVAAITGLRNSPRMIRYQKDTAALLVVFSAGGAAAFFKQPLHELFQSSLSLDELVDCRELEERLSSAVCTAQRIAIVERFLISLLKGGQDGLVLDAVQRIKYVKGDLKIKSLAGELNISQDAFEKRFRKITGTSPKQFAITVRLRSIIEQYSKPDSLTSVAYTAGYFDQAHFIKDFRSFTGQTPQSFFTSAVFW